MVCVPALSLDKGGGFMLLLGCLQVSRLVQMQKETLADERAVILGEHKAELKTLVSVMSASINRDLPARIEEMIGRAVCLPLRFDSNPPARLTRRRGGPLTCSGHPLRLHWGSGH